MNKEEHFLINRFNELADVAFNRNIYTNTEFLNINEINILESVKNKLPPVRINLTGGNNYAERKIAIFSPMEIYYQEEIPVSIIKIAPKNSKYADNLTHRDYLVAILNLGIVRSKIGDIFIKDNIAYIYCMSDIAEYICENLTKVKHTFIDNEVLPVNNSVDIKPTLKNITGTISNVRLDSVISTAFNMSRNSIIVYIENGKVFVNGKLITSNGYSIKENDIISVRGLGRFVFNRVLKETKKGRNLISIDLYV